jgi:hypothetical protein
MSDLNDKPEVLNELAKSFGRESSPLQVLHLDEFEDSFQKDPTHKSVADTRRGLEAIRPGGPH